MSAPAHAPGDLIRGLHWAATDTGTDRVAEALARLLREAEHLGGDHVSLRTMNLLVAPHAGPVAPVPHDGGSREELALHPARMVRLARHDADRLDGEVRVRLVRVGEARMDVRVEDVHLRADEAVPYGRVVEVLGAARQAGLTRIGFVAEAPAPAVARSR